MIGTVGFGQHNRTNEGTKYRHFNSRVQTGHFRTTQTTRYIDTRRLRAQKATTEAYGRTGTQIVLMDFQEGTHVYSYLLREGRYVGKYITRGTRGFTIGRTDNVRFCITPSITARTKVLRLLERDSP